MWAPSAEGYAALTIFTTQEGLTLRSPFPSRPSACHSIHSPHEIISMAGKTGHVSQRKRNQN